MTQSRGITAQQARPAPDLSTSPRAIWRLTWPQMLMMYLMFFMGFVAVWVAGQISADVQAALGMVNQCGILLMVVAMAVSSGATAAVSQSLGALRVMRAQRYIGTTGFYVGGTSGQRRAPYFLTGSCL